MREILVFMVCFWVVFVGFGQKLCGDKPPEKSVSECCDYLPKRTIDLLLNETCNSKYSKNTKKQIDENPEGEALKGDCVFECIANQTRIYRGNGMIDRVTLKRVFMNSVSGDRLWGNIVAKVVDICVNETRIIFKNYKFNRTRSFDNEVLCHPISGYVFGCIQTEIFVKCPNMTQSTECENLLLYATNCHLGVKY